MIYQTWLMFATHPISFFSLQLTDQKQTHCWISIALVIKGLKSLPHTFTYVSNMPGFWMTARRVCSDPYVSNSWQTPGDTYIYIHTYQKLVKIDVGTYHSFRKNKDIVFGTRCTNPSDPSFTYFCTIRHILWPIQENVNECRRCKALPPPPGTRGH